MRTKRKYKCNSTDSCISACLGKSDQSSFTFVCHTHQLCTDSRTSNPHNLTAEGRQWQVNIQAVRKLQASTISSQRSKSRRPTCIDYGVHLQDGDIPFVERHFITRPSSTFLILHFLFFIGWNLKDFKKKVVPLKKKLWLRCDVNIF